MGLRRFVAETSGKEEETPSPLIIKIGPRRRQWIWGGRAKGKYITQPYSEDSKNKNKNEI